MFDSSILNIIIGLLFIFLLYSLLATILQEIIATTLNLRGYRLSKSIKRMLDGESADKGFSKLFYSHPLIRSFRSGSMHAKPSYLSDKNFSKVLVDLLRGKEAKAGESFAPAIQNSLEGSKMQWTPGGKIAEPTNELLKSFWADSQGDVEKFRAILESWFNNSMEHVSGSYKRRTQLLLFFIGLCLAVFFNLNAIMLSKKLSSNPDLAKKLADNASVFLAAHKELGSKLTLEQQPVFIANDSSGLLIATDEKMAKERILFSRSDSSVLKINLTKDRDQQVIDSMQFAMIQKASMLIDSANAIIHSDIEDTNDLLGIGWTCKEKTTSIVSCIKETVTWSCIVGWVITALAISLGAPFWFDLLTRFIKLRGSASKPEDQRLIGSAESNTDRVG